jgi:hypothetical protein
MTSADPFTTASPRYFYALRHPHKEGEAMEWMPKRIRWLRLSASVLLGAIVGVSARECGAGLVTACAVGLAGAYAVRVSDGWVRS